MTRISKNTDLNTVEGLLGRLEQLNDIGVALSQERDITRLLEYILMAAKGITRADGGTIYSKVVGSDSLRFEILRTDSLHIAMGGSANQPINFTDLPLLNADGEPNDSLVAAYAAIHAVTVNIEDAYSEPNFDFSGTRKFDQNTGYRSKSFLTVPMCNQDGDVIGVLQLLNALKPGTDEVTTFSKADQQLVESLASQAAIALSNRLLMKQLEDLFESFISLINLAIDEKSPYTGGHCQRVPALTMMLADAAAAHQEGPLADFSMTEMERYELKIAGLLHDCGKVTTPVHVVDKATKLQTLFDRIDLVDTRFEVLKRDAEIEALRRQLALRPCVDAEAEGAAMSALQGQLNTLDADRNFLRTTNSGGEFMSDAAVARVHHIGSHHQWRNPNGPKVLLLSRHDQPALEDKAILAGASGIINQQSAPEHLLYAIEKIQQGQIWLDRQAMARLLASLPAVEPSSPPSPANEALARLSQREQRILAKMLRYSGESAREIAKRLHISESTLRNHLTSIYGKCGVSNRSGLVAYAQQHGLAELLLD